MKWSVRSAGAGRSVVADRGDAFKPVDDNRDLNVRVRARLRPVAEEVLVRKFEAEGVEDRLEILRRARFGVLAAGLVGKPTEGLRIES